MTNAEIPHGFLNSMKTHHHVQSMVDVLGSEADLLPLAMSTLPDLLLRVSYFIFVVANISAAALYGCRRL